ncbi:hypothetical protein ATN84_11840 [Paramesorhizobium deserti]|uniref:CENP-V/GFA domain-containing protein n=1 Tax=Paramesorhizobium deserti TaxID=1494590 RepID=A0A135HU53_9HYPH|nr:DUF6151 family protein [Paramesorhizobium deserti]KXF76720.1 hypothetical protein ATN84_11840 [Paramesorhizobium deserti]
MKQTTQLACACGKFHLELEAAPIIGAECHCSSCREAGARLQTLPTAGPVLQQNGGTRFVLYRKDRVRFLDGAEWLKEFRLKPESKTRRVIATCCNTPVFLEFQGGHWLSLYESLWPEGTTPPPALRTMTSDIPAGTTLSDDVPNAKHHSFSFFAKLLSAWIAMGFRSPKVQINGAIDA